ncbi:DUF6153 family protein [Micromonospora sp. HM5-17]|uniref:DUF6153 family protein n=1 Tax=Micromonospora sp. HM5-17 TaxID=2487710 RepID=UPI0011CDBEA8|nr:DUF6153 family protein [Micromonospora sp. HM5-17]
MTGAARDQLRRSRTVIRVLAIVAGLVGLIFMHQLVGTPATGEHHHSRAATSAESAHHLLGELDDPSAVTAGPGTDCPPGDVECPNLPHGHPGQVCQLTPPGYGPVASPPALAPMPVAPPPLVIVLSPQTAAQEAAGGSGCGPPSLTELSIWRV